MTQKDRLIQSEHRFQGKYEASLFKALGYSYKPHRVSLISLSVLGLLGRGFLLANANIIGSWVDSLCRGPQCRTLPDYFSGWASGDFMTLLIIMVAIGFVLTWVFRVGFSGISAQAVSRLYDETTLRTSRLPIRFFDQTPVGRVVTRFSSDYGNVFRLFGGPLAEFMSILFDLFWMIILISIASPLYLPLLVVMAVCNYLAYRRNKSYLRECRRELSASRSPSVAHFSETAQGASTIRSFVKQKSFSERFSNLDRYFLAQKMKTTKAIVAFALQMNGLTALLLGIAGLISIYGINQGLLSVGSIGVAFGLITLSGTTVQNFFDWLAQFEEAMVGVERLNHYLQSDLEPGARLPEIAGFPTHHPRDRALDQNQRQDNPLGHLRAAPVKFDRVSFRYSEDLPWIFEDLSFEVKAGERFGIVGRTGSGKSSLIQALFHLYPLAGGKITVGDWAPRLGRDQDADLDLLAFRRSLAFIAQDPTLFRGSLRDNLDVDRRHPDQALISALLRVGLDEWASVAGLSHVIEEKGRNLSLGEKQLISLARCLLQNAPVVIMDEATSSIDPKSEEILVKATEEFFAGRTQLIIAHRLSTLRSCDRILWLKNGKIVRIGPPGEVLPEFEATSHLPAESAAT